MKITRVALWQPAKLNRTINQSNLVVTIETDSGLVGVGEGGTPELVSQCAGALIGQDPRRIHHLWQLLYRGWFYPAGREKLHALGALDLALWDLKGKALGAPVHELLGGLTRDHIECYATGYPSAGSLGQTATACLGAGFRAFRTAVSDAGTGVFDSRRMVDQTIADCAAIREAIGPDGDWCIDFHTRLDLADAVRCAGGIEHLAPLFVEDPLRSENAPALTALRAQVKVPIAVGEQFGDRWDLHELVEAHVIDWARVTLPNVGGLTEFAKIAALCETHYVGLAPHGTGAISTAALVHALGSFAGPAIQEIGGGWPVAVPHVRVGVDFRDGRLWPNERPGLGVEFVPEETRFVGEITAYDAPIPTFRRPDGSVTNW